MRLLQRENCKLEEIVDKLKDELARRNLDRPKHAEYNTFVERLATPFSDRNYEDEEYMGPRSASSKKSRAHSRHRFERDQRQASAASLAQLLKPENLYSRIAPVG